MADEAGPPRPKREVNLCPRPSNVCVCFHVPLNKITSFIRQRRPKVASQISECFGAGTGCGWCIPFLEKIHEAMKANPDAPFDMGLTEEEYLTRRREYHARINAKRMKDEREGDGKKG